MYPRVVQISTIHFLDQDLKANQFSVLSSSIFGYKGPNLFFLVSALHPTVFNRSFHVCALHPQRIFFKLTPNVHWATVLCVL